MAKYSKTSQKKVQDVMHEMKTGKLKNGRGGRKVTNPKQAIAIGLSEARKKGAKVPPPPKKAAKKAAPKKALVKKAAPKKALAKKAASKKAPVKKAAIKKAAPKKAAAKKTGRK